MSPLKSASIFGKLAIGFGVVVLLTALMGGFAIRTLSQLWQYTADLYEHPFTVSTATLQANRSFSTINRSLLRDVVAGTDLAAIEVAIDRVAILDADMTERLARARPRYLGPPQDFADIDKVVADWRQMREDIIVQVRRGHRQEAEALLLRRGKEVDEAVVAAMGKVIDFAIAKATYFEDEAARQQADARMTLQGSVLALTILGLGIAVLITRGIVSPLDALRRRMIELAEGRLSVTIPFTPAGRELEAMAAAVRVFKQALLQLNDRGWVKTQITELAAAMQAAATPEDLAITVTSRLTPQVDGGCAAFHLWDAAAGCFHLIGGYGLAPGDAGSRSCRPGEGLVGQCAAGRETIMLTDLPTGYLRIASGIGEASPRVLIVAPVLVKESVLGVIEIAAFRPFSEIQRALIDELMPVIGLNLEVLERNMHTRRLLLETQRQAEELKVSEEELRAQSDELQAANEELRVKTETLQRQTEALRVSEEELRAQREELQATNEELTEKSSALEAARQESENRVLELDIAGRYKSEFLANMSHELRTPLNSLLILSKNLADNEQGNLDGEQVESAAIIHESGTHLLHLINDVLDLSKVEAGKMVVASEPVDLGEFSASIRRRFLRLAEAKQLSLTVETAADLPSKILGDRPKMDQILNNLVGNAIKFTETGGVGVRISVAAEAGGPTLEIAVSDTGVGVAADKLDRIFAAFEQADGSTSRHFGGTGLGLTISQRLAGLLGGNVAVRSVPGKGSTFTLRLPLREPAEGEPPPPRPMPPPRPAAVAQPIPEGDLILVIEDDDTFAKVLCGMAERRGFACVRAADGDAGVELALRHRPTGILLDVGLPGRDGWSVMAALKENPSTRSIPVHFITAIDDSMQGMRMGAAGFLTKPIDARQMDEVFERLRHFATGARRVLIVDDDAGARKATALLVHGDQVEIVEAKNGEQALARLKGEHFDCVVLDLILPDISGFELLDRATAAGIILPPVVVYSGKDLSYEENLKLREYTDSIVIKGVRSPERLVDEVSLFLHSVQSARPTEPRRPTPEAGPLAGIGVLVVDDDMRNAFALSKVLRGARMTVLLAQDGGKALAQLDEHPDVNAVLMDIMMPGMDGITTIREIRKQARFARLPIIALTAKAMPGDRERCLEAGANEYMAKPVDTGRLLTMIAELLADSRPMP